MFFGHVRQKFSLGVLLSFSLMFGQFQSRVAYKSVAYKKSVLFAYKVILTNLEQSHINIILVFLLLFIIIQKE